VVQKQRTFTDEIRRAILDAKERGVSRYWLAQQLHVSEGVLSGFVNGTHGISSDLLDRLAPLLGLRLVVGRPRNARRKS
jgi:plasmid maintenance system antidote protein VapI